MTHFLDGFAAQDADFKYQLIVPVARSSRTCRHAKPRRSTAPVVAELIKAHQKVTGKRPIVGAGHRIGATADTCHFKGVGIDLRRIRSRASSRPGRWSTNASRSQQIVIGHQGACPDAAALLV